MSLQPHDGHRTAGRDTAPIFQSRTGYSPRILSPRENAEAVSQLNRALGERLLAHPVTSYEFIDPRTKSRLVVATVGDLTTESSPRFSLGGFRIVPKEDALRPNFQPLESAAALALEMEEKISVARLLQIGGDRGQPYLRNRQAVGGKCVFVPGDGCWPGERYDRIALDFAGDCLETLRKTTSCVPATGQDVGHGILSPTSKKDSQENVTSYLHKAYRGSVDVDTSIPTAHGLYHLYRGMLAGLEIPWSDTRLSLYGAGKIGTQLLRLALESKVGAIWVYDSSPAAAKAARRVLESYGSRSGVVFEGDRRHAFFTMPSDAIAFNAYKHDLTNEVAQRFASLAHKPRIVGGCENNLIPLDEESSVHSLLLKERMLFAPTTLCGPWGALAALEASICALQDTPYSPLDIVAHTHRMERIGATIAKAFHESRQPIPVSQILEDLF